MTVTVLPELVSYKQVMPLLALALFMGVSSLMHATHTDTVCKSGKPVYALTQDAKYVSAHNGGFLIIEKTSEKCD